MRKLTVVCILVVVGMLFSFNNVVAGEVSDLSFSKEYVFENKVSENFVSPKTIVKGHGFMINLFDSGWSWKKNSKKGLYFKGGIYMWGLLNKEKKKCNLHILEDTKGVFEESDDLKYLLKSSRENISTIFKGGNKKRLITDVEKTFSFQTKKVRGHLIIVKSLLKGGFKIESSSVIFRNKNNKRVFISITMILKTKDLSLNTLILEDVIKGISLI